MSGWMEKVLWCGGGDYDRHRIPGMIVTRRGTLLAYREARQNMSDWARMDILLSRSTDFGATFQPDILLAQGTETHPTVNNPVMVEDARGDIHFLYCEDYAVEGGRVLHRISRDDGVTWSRPEDISDATAPAFRNVFAPGPGHGICLSNGTLIVPVWLVPRRPGRNIRNHGPSVTSTLYSTDDGITWKLGEMLPDTPSTPSPNETSAAERSDGGVYMNIRVTAGQGCRVQACSPTGYSGWTDYHPVQQLPDPSCFGSVTAYHDGEHPYTLIFGNCAHASERKNVTVRMSVDNGASFPVSRTLCADGGGYVETAVDHKNGWIYVLYERNMGEKVTLVRMRYEDLTAEK